MNPDVTNILNAIGRGEAQAAEQLLPLVYQELRQLAKRKLSLERPGQTMDATGLVHEAYLRLVNEQGFENRRHFFGAAAVAMRRIPVERARRRMRIKHGGERRREPLQADLIVGPQVRLQVTYRRFWPFSYRNRIRRQTLLVLVLVLSAAVLVLAIEKGARS